ncbi:MAG: hypothetical protein WCP34_05080, partial [Pseudomonadota bacterium]
MTTRYMLLPSQNPDRARLLELPPDLEPLEAYRYVTGVIAQIEETQGPVPEPDEVCEALEELGFRPLPLVWGPRIG